MFGRIATLFRGFLSLFISGIEKQNPEAILEAEKEKLRQQIAKYNTGLASHAGLCENLMSQVKRLEVEEQDLRAKITANLRAGNRDAASQYALRLQGVSKQLQDSSRELEQSEGTYKDLIKARDVSVKAARDKMESLKRGIDDLKIKKAQAELTEMATGMIGTIGGSGDTLNRLTEMVEDERNKAAGRARVAHDSIDTTEITMKDSEQKALADQALADFAAREGITLDSSAVTPAADAPAKSMGPNPEVKQDA